MLVSMGWCCSLPDVRRTWETALDDEDTQLQRLLDFIGIDERAAGALSAGELGGVAKPAVRLPVGAVAHVVVLSRGEVLDSERIALRRSGRVVVDSEKGHVRFPAQSENHTENLSIWKTR